MKRTLAVPVLVVLVAGWSALGAGGAGGPSPGIKFASSGVLSRDGSTRYVALYANRGTVVESVRTRDGSIDRSVYFRGTYGLPFVAFDGSTGGLSADGRRLVLSTWPAYGRKAFTRFVVLDPRTLRIRSRLDLEGAFAFDALSPSGSVMYLTRFLGGPGSGRYGVRALSLDTKRLYPGAIIDRREPDEKMTGQPMTRTGSGDGKWAYTLYSRTGKSPFVHALDTVHRRAFCVDVPCQLSANDLSKVRLRLDGAHVLVRLGHRVVARIDRQTFRVTG